MSPLGGGGGIPWSNDLVVTKDACTLITSSGCVFVAIGWVRLCVTVEMGYLFKETKFVELFLHLTLGFEGHPQQEFCHWFKTSYSRPYLVYLPHNES